jgi:hypothetical protein
MGERGISEKELKLTAALYASRSDVVKTVRETGKLPEAIPIGGFSIAANIVIRERGEDITLTEDEQLVYDALLREKRLPGGSVILISEEIKYRSMMKKNRGEKNQLR